MSKKISYPKDKIQEYLQSVSTKSKKARSQDEINSVAFKHASSKSVDKNFTYDGKTHLNKSKINRSGKTRCYKKIREDLTNTVVGLKDMLKNQSLAKYIREIINLCYYYKYYKSKQSPNNDFFMMNNEIFDWLQKHDCDKFIDDQLIDQPEKVQSIVQEKWKKLKQVLHKQSYYDFDTSDDFVEFLAFLLGKPQIILQLVPYLIESSKYEPKRGRDIEVVTKVFLCIIFDLPKYRIQLDEGTGMQMKIFITPIKGGRIFTNDVMYIFSKVDNIDDETGSTAVDMEDSFSNSLCIEIIIIKKEQNIVKLTERESNAIKETFSLDNVTKCIEFTSVTLSHSIGGKLCLCLFSFFSILDIILDIILAYKFWANGQTAYSILTITLLIVAGIANIIVNEYLVQKYNFLDKYSQTTCNNIILRYLLSFLQLSAFFKTVSATWSYWRRSNRLEHNEEFKMLVDNIVHGHPEYIEESTTRANFVEMFFETRPQTILQIYILLKGGSITNWQIVTIFVSIVLMLKTTLAFVGVHKRMKLKDFFKNPIKNKCLLLREISYFGFTLIFHSLLFCQLPWYCVLSWILIDGLVSCCTTGKKISEDTNLIIFNWDSKCLRYWKFFNYWTVVEVFCFTAYLFHSWINYKIPENEKYFVGLLILGMILFMLWLNLMAIDAFYYRYNIMYVPWHMKNSGTYPAQAKEDKNKMNDTKVDSV